MPQRLAMELKAWIKLSGTKPKDFARKLGCQLTTIYRYMSGQRSPSLLQAVEIKRATDGAVTLDDLAQTVIDNQHNS
jgi:DNA-binding transcriptional regulator YdaS (Cro superfamily)